MDGARFANALVRLNASPAEMTWRSGVDVLSFGATKGGAMAAEAVIVFDPTRAAHLGERRKRAGALLSKHRFMAAQFLAYLADDNWLTLARHANAKADRLARNWPRWGFRRSGRSRPIWSLPRCHGRSNAKLRAAGASYYVRSSESSMSEPTMSWFGW